NRQERVGSLEVGKQADVVLWNVENYQELQYLFGVNHVKSVWKNGVQVVNDKVKTDTKSLTGL
ncbi:amidohydrolase family protein, partial [Peribacillus frigoritolerans]|uniref:amidohydrolase family protein n=2 Tax=Bacillaceae TaxID=186817 RepID=UPI001E5E4F88